MILFCSIFVGCDPSTQTKGTPKIVDLKIDEKLFGEGLALNNDTIYQLTWRSGKVLIYDRDFNLIKENQLSSFGEGWGVTAGDNQLFMSDGSNKIRVLASICLFLLKVW